HASPLNHPPRLITLIWSNLKRLVSVPFFLKGFGFERTRTLKQHNTPLAALHPYKARARLADSIGYLHTENFSVEAFRTIDVIHRNANVVYANRLNHGFPPFCYST